MTDVERRYRNQAERDMPSLSSNDNFSRRSIDRRTTRGRALMHSYEEGRSALTEDGSTNTSIPSSLAMMLALAGNVPTSARTEHTAFTSRAHCVHKHTPDATHLPTPAKNLEHYPITYPAVPSRTPPLAASRTTNFYVHTGSCMVAQQMRFEGMVTANSNGRPRGESGYPSQRLPCEARTDR